jgi:hypothetical protein
MGTRTWRVIGASVQGTSHHAKNFPCQDAHCYRVLPCGELLIAVADGAGSAERSQEGAQCAVQQVIAALEGALQNQPPGDEAAWQALMTKAFGEARESLVQLATVADAPLRSFATTLTCVAVVGDWLAVGQIGDGATVAETTNNSLFLTVHPQRGEYANETYFLTMPDALHYVATAIHSQLICALVVTTDGLLRLALKLPEYEPYSKFLQPLLAFAAEAENKEQAQTELATFLDSERVCARTDDDKTLVLAVRLDTANQLLEDTEARSGDGA